MREEIGDQAELNERLEQLDLVLEAVASAELLDEEQIEDFRASYVRAYNDRPQTAVRVEPLTSDVGPLATAPNSPRGRHHRLWTLLAIVAAIVLVLGGERLLAAA